MTPELFKFSGFLAGLALFLAIESMAPARAWRNARAKRLGFHLVVAAFNQLVLRFTVLFPLLAVADHVHRERWGFGAALGLPFWLEIPLSIVVLDFFDWIWHLSNHRVPFLWRFHKVHHVDTMNDVTTSLRFHPGELVISGFVKMSWLVIWGPSVWAFAIFELLVTLSAQFHHANFDFPDRVEKRLAWIVMTPRGHLAHHSATTRAIDMNFATILSVWDRIFRTRVEPTPEHLVEQGLPYGRDRELDPAYLLTLPARPDPAPGGDAIPT